MGKDLRYFINYLERTHPEEFVRVKKEVSPRWELSALMDNVQRRGRNPVMLFENVKGNKMPVIANVYASRKLQALSFESTVDKLVTNIVRGEANPIPPKIVSAGPVKDVIKIGEQASLMELPIVYHCEKDAGPYITAGVGVMKDPDTGIRNAGMYRMQLKEPRKLGFVPGPASHAAALRRKYETLGKDMEIAVVIGHHPLLAIASQFNGSLDVDEMGVFGAHLGEPAELVKCETVDLEVPANAEIIIEGRVKHNYEEPEGPMGEMFYYGGRSKGPVIEVSAITHRRDAIYQDIFIIGYEHSSMGNLGIEPALYRHVKQAIPQLLDVRIANLGGGKLLYLKLKQEYDGLAKQAGLAALGFSSYINGVIVFDEDIDINSEKDVAWAMGMRIQGQHSIMLLPEIASSHVDPLAHKVGDRTRAGTVKSKFIIDATNPVELELPERAYPPEDIRQKMRVEDYLDW